MASNEELEAKRKEEKEAAKQETAPLAVASSIKKNAQDFSQLVAAKIPECIDLAKQNQFSAALDQLLALEKKTRTGEDMMSTKRVLEAIVEVCAIRSEWKALEESITSLSKRRGLIKESFKGMVKKTAALLDLPASQLPEASKFSLFDTLLAVTEGRIFVEKQRARLVLKLAHIRESEGKVAEAAKLLQEVQVETFGAMKKQEKTEYILEQMRLCLKKKDYVRTQIISRKIHPKVLLEVDEAFQRLKIRYHELMVEYYTNSGNNLEIAKAYYQIYETPMIKSDQNKLEAALKLVSIYLVLSPKTNEQADFIHRLVADPAQLAPSMAVYLRLLNLFVTQEVMDYLRLQAQITAEISNLPPFQRAEEADRLWKDLHLRIVEHNIQVVAQYYTRIRLSRLSHLLHLSESETEKHLSRLVIAKTVYAKMDRPQGIVAFRRPQSPNDVLNAWATDIDTLLGLVENTVHLIQREHMVNARQGGD